MMVVSSLQSRSITDLGGLPVMQGQDAVVLQVVLTFIESKMDYLGTKRNNYSVFYVVY